MLKIAVVGPGLMGKQHIECLKVIDDVYLRAIVAPLTEKNKQYARCCEVEIFSSIKDCINSIDIDGVIIASPNEYHLEQARFCIYNKIPVLIEKPLTTNLEDGQELLSLAKKMSFINKVMVGHHRSYSVYMRSARQIIQSGSLGRLVTFQGSAQFYKPKLYFEAGAWRTLPGGGPILLNMIHEVGVMRELMGEIFSVQAIQSSNVRGFDVEDTSVINIYFESGALGSFVLSDTAASNKSWEMTSSENPSFPYYKNDYCYSVSGTKGSLDIPTMTLRYYPNNKDRSWINAFKQETHKITHENPLINQLKRFVDVIVNDEKPLVSLEDGYKNLLVVDTIIRAGITGKTEKVEF